MGNYTDIFNGEESMSTSDVVATLLPYHQVNILTSNGTGSPGNYSYLQDMFRTFSTAIFEHSPLLLQCSQELGGCIKAWLPKMSREMVSQLLRNNMRTRLNKVGSFY